VVFFSDEDKRLYYEILMQEKEKAKIAVWAYCMMSNHVHLVAIPEMKNSLAKGIGESQRKYSRIINIRYDWKGHLWQERYKSNPMGRDYLYSAVRYIERNPVRAGIVEKAEDYFWSSAKAHVYGGNDELLSDFYLTSEIPDWSTYLGEEIEESEIKLIRSHVHSGLPLGNDEFIDNLERTFGMKLRKKKPGPRSK
jgi:putative transposase